MALKANSKIKKVLSAIANVLLALLVIVGIFVVISLFPIKDNYKLLAVTSGSMEPAIGVGSLVIIKPANNYQVGDIITFKKDNTTSSKETTTHRVQSISEDNGVKVYTTKGDANNVADSQKVNENQIVGKYRFGIALLGYMLKYLKTLPGLILIIVIPATIIIYEEAKKIAKEAKAIRAKKIATGSKSTEVEKISNKSPKKEKK